MQCGIEGEIGNREKGEKSLQTRSLMGMGSEMLLHSRPKFRGDDDRNAGERRIGKLLETGSVAQHRDAGARVEKKGRLHRTTGSKPEDRTVVLAGARWWFWEVTSIWKPLRKVARDLGEGPELWRRQGFENDILAVFFDLHLGAVKAEGLRQAYRLAPSMLENLGRNHIYTVYLWLAAFKPEGRRVAAEVGRRTVVAGSRSRPPHDLGGDRRIGFPGAGADTDSMSDVTPRLQVNDPGASTVADPLLPRVYPELKRLAAARDSAKTRLPTAMKTNLSMLAFLGANLISAAGEPAKSLQDMVAATASLPSVTIYTAKEIVTLDPAQPKVEAVAVVGGYILDVGSLDELKKAAGKQPYVVDNRFADKVIVPGFIAQHDHPFLAALAMTSEIIAIEDWVLPSGTVPAAKDHDHYIRRLIEANAKLEDPEALLFTWGFHSYFHGKMTRADLDRISATRPILVWHRSCHEFYLNSVALKKFGVTREWYDKLNGSAKEQSNFEEGHFWEQGVFAVLPLVAPGVFTPQRLGDGLQFVEEYLHANGVTVGCEPGGVLSKPLQEAQNAVFSDPSTPFRYYFIADGKSITAAQPDEKVIPEAEKLLTWGQGNTSYVSKQVKLFADGAIYSQAMQVREPYTDGHQGEWMMDLDFFERSFRVYWDAGYQIHIHVNGDAGLDMVLNTLEKNMRRYPRHDHRTVIVHFAVSQKDQVERIKRLGAIVSANAYYTTALSDKYSTAGLGPERANSMVRMGDVERAGISYSYHSDMPMAPAQPLFLMHCGVNRTTQSGRVAAPEQCVSREGALKAVTLGAAYSLQMEKEIGSIVVGKRANFTILADNPVTCDAAKIKDIAVIATIHEGRVFPVKGMATKTTSYRFPGNWKPVANNLVTSESSHFHDRDGCACAVGSQIADQIFTQVR